MDPSVTNAYMCLHEIQCN